MVEETDVPPLNAIVSGGDFVFTHLGVCTLKIHRGTGESYVLVSPELGKYHWVKVSDAPMPPISAEVRARMKK